MAAVVSIPSPTAERPTGSTAEWTARPLHPVARWMLTPDATGRDHLTCVWEVPDPQPIG